MNNTPETSNKNLIIPQHNEIKGDFKQALKVVDDVVLKNYITKLKDFDIFPLDQDIKDNNISDNVRFFKINEMVYEKDEYSTYKFASVFNAAATRECAVFILIDSNGSKTDFYMGIRSMNPARNTKTSYDTLEHAIQGQFPGIKTSNILEDEMIEILEKIKVGSISSVTSVADNKNSNISENKNFVQGLEKLALAMHGEKYTGIIIANSTPQNQLAEIRRAYEDVYTKLSPFANLQVSYNSNKSLNLATSLTQGTSEGTSYNKNTSTSKSTGTSTSESLSTSLSKETLGSIVGKGAAGAIGAAGFLLAPFTGGASMLIGGVLAAGVVGATQSTKTDSTSSSSSNTENTSETSGENFGENKNRNQSATDTKGLTTGSSENLQLTMQNKSIINTLERIDTQLKRLNKFESVGMWECSAYFLSDNTHVAEIAASTYKALMRGENSGVEMSAINTWNKADNKKLQLLKEYVINFMHPVFKYENNGISIPVMPTSFVSGDELAIHMGLPRKSICGFPVLEHADFGKEVISCNEKTNHSINLGKIFNLGKEFPLNRVLLDINSLSMHTFVTGSTGSGKSNTVYEILDQLDRVGINFLVIEPAKGEYKHILGNRKDVTVFGTNPEYSKLLKVNPFKFPSPIHVLEHIDRLIEIFNVCWPMYAAMPAVLKEAVLQAYEVSGWNLSTSINQYSRDMFPTFIDLLTELNKVIETSAYSQELKSNYIGALSTRIKSLTNGINGQIFPAEEIDNTLLFDKNVIVDLSRIGSLETKSLIMGILVMRLNEHRMSFTEGMNRPLTHVTVLEEAHNILKRTSSEQSTENPSLAGKSIEMLSNAIAEMRTYGEGFIIVDQSPSSVDMSAIRNTNTKIIMRLPDESDRRLAGKSAALKEEQLDEIAKLPKGVAVLYQNDWREPVLCKISKFDGEDNCYKYYPEKQFENDINIDFKSELLKLLLKGRVNDNVDVNLDALYRMLNHATISTKNKIAIRNCFEEYKNTNNLTIWSDEKFMDLSEVVSELLDSKSFIECAIASSPSYEDLSVQINNYLEKNTTNLTEDVKLSIQQCFLKNISKESPEKADIYAAWIATQKRRYF